MSYSLLNKLSATWENGLSHFLQLFRSKIALDMTSIVAWMLKANYLSITVSEEAKMNFRLRQFFHVASDILTYK